jgi:nitrite reductase/ring-hydroxylating ferredoxin subunit
VATPGNEGALAQHHHDRLAEQRHVRCSWSRASGKTQARNDRQMLVLLLAGVCTIPLPVPIAAGAWRRASQACLRWPRLIRFAVGVSWSHVGHPQAPDGRLQHEVGAKAPNVHARCACRPQGRKVDGRWRLGDMRAGRLVCQLDGRSVIVVRARRQLVAVENRCPHLAQPLSTGRVGGTVIRCAGHGLQWDLISGRSVPCSRGIVPGSSLRPWSLRVVGGRILLATGRSVASATGMPVNAEERVSSVRRR